MAFSKLTSAGYLANHMARLFEQALLARIRPLGIVPGQFPALLELWERDGRTQAELLQRIDVEQATLALTLKRMERDGLIRREPHPSDSRARIILLTDRAKALREEALRCAEEVNETALADLGPEERARFVEAMRRAIDALRQDAGKVPLDGAPKG